MLMLKRETNGIWSTYKVQWPSYVKDLPRTLDRFRTVSVFFDLQFPTFLKASIDARKWISWASIAALISIGEVLEIDFEDLGYTSQWKSSKEYSEIKENEILLVLKELRNYEIHIDFQERVPHFKIESSLVKEHIDHDSFFFSPIDWNQISKLKNIRTGRSKLTKEIIEKFNENYAKRYSVETIISSMMDWYAEKIYIFLERMKNDNQQVVD
jgi:hypothetical protein